MSFVKELLNLMEKKNYTARDTAKMFGVTPLTVYHWLGRHYFPHPAVQKVIIKEFKNMGTLVKKEKNNGR